MFGLDEAIAGLAAGQPLLLATVVAVLLGLRHAADPDHLSAVSTLVAAEPDRRARRAARFGLAWGAGHGTTLILFGLPIVLFANYLPEWALRAAEVAIGALIVALATRLIIRWRRGLLHLHEHEHAGVRHAHLHGHEETARHEHTARPVRSTWAAYGIGLIHGLGGSAGVGVLLLASIENTPLAVAALIVFGAFTAVSMSACSGAFGLGLSLGPVRRGFDRLAPALGVAGVAFGTWYALGAMGAAPYPF